MACILMLECIFMHGYFRCLLPEETVDMEVKVKMMRGIHNLHLHHPGYIMPNNGVPDSVLAHL